MIASRATRRLVHSTCCRGGVLDVLKACESASEGRRLHANIKSQGLQWHPEVQSQLLQMYLRCSSVMDARLVFDAMVCPNVFLCTMVMGAVGRTGNNGALQIFGRMLQDGTVPDVWAMVTIIAACGDARDATGLRRIHLLAQDECRNGPIGNALVNMYGRCGLVGEAAAAFKNTRNRGVLGWNAMVAAFSQNGHCTEAFETFCHMLLEAEAPPNRNTYVVFLDGCAHPDFLAACRMLHSCAMEAGYGCDPVLITALINVYGNCGSFEDARRVFEDSSAGSRDVITWTAIITAAFVREEVMQLFWRMQLEGVTPDCVTLVNVLNCCTSGCDLVHGAAVHAAARERGLDRTVVAGNAIITMYNKCGNIDQARSVFDDMRYKDAITWSSMLSAYTSRCRGQEALVLFRELLLHGEDPNRASFVLVLGGFSLAEGDERNLSHGRFVHRLVNETGHDQFTNVANALINMYGVCEYLEGAFRIFDNLEDKDLVSWNAILSLHSQTAERTVHLYREMQLHGTKPDHVSFLAVLAACTSAGFQKTGKLVHSNIVESGILMELDIQNSLLNMYGKCGNLDIARMLFNDMHVRENMSWNGMLVAYSNHGHGKEAIQLFYDMLLDGMAANAVTLVAVLSACSHGGMLEQGCRWFASMDVDHGITTQVEHYGCMVDLLARAGWLFEAENYFAANTGGCSLKSWLALLNACKIHGDVDRAGRAAERVIGMEPSTSAGYIILANAMQ